MVAGKNQILLLSDNADMMASLEGALARGQFRLHRMDHVESLPDRLDELAGSIDAAIVDGTAPVFSNGQLDATLSALDQHQLGAVLLTGPGGGNGDHEHLPLVWPVRVGDAERLAMTLEIIAGYQCVVRGLHREIRLAQRLDRRISGQLGEIDEEMRLASRIQRDFLPKRLPDVGPARFATLFRPATWVSGDIYDVFRLDEKHVGFYIADAVGHGMPAALLTMFIKRSMETKQIDDAGYSLLPPEQTMATLNAALVQAALSSNQFTTALYAILDVDDLTLQFARGGHPHPLWLKDDGSTVEPEAEGGLLGVFDDMEFSRCTVQLEPGDKFVLYSDGMETVFVDGDQFCTDLYRDYIEKVRHLSADEMLNDLVRHMDAQAGSLNPRDDVTLVVCEIAK